MLKRRSTSALPAAPGRPGLFRIVGIGDQRPGHCLRITGGHQMAGAPGLDQFRVATHVGGDHRQARRHGLQDGVGNTLGERRQDKAVQPAQDFRHIMALPGQPGEIGHASPFEQIQSFDAQWSIADHDQAQASLERRARSQWHG